MEFRDRLGEGNRCNVCCAEFGLCITGVPLIILLLLYIYLRTIFDPIQKFVYLLLICLILGIPIIYFLSVVIICYVHFYNFCCPPCRHHCRGNYWYTRKSCISCGNNCCNYLYTKKSCMICCSFKYCCKE